MNDEITYRSFESQDVRRVNELFEEAYGEWYPYKADRRVPTGSYYFVAEVEASQRVVGFARSQWLEPAHTSLAYPYVHELGGYVVDETYRRRGIGEKLSAMCEEAACAERGGIHVLNSEPVTWGNGLASQRIFQKHGFRVIGLCPVKYPGISPDWLEDQPASMTLVARRREGDGDFSQYQRFLPPDYEIMVGELMHGCPLRQQNYGWRDGHIPPTVHYSPVTAEDSSSDISTGSEIIDVPANWPETSLLIEELRSMGYLFCGFLPEHGGVPVNNGAQFIRFDYIRLWRPPSGLVINWDLIGVIPEAQYVKDFVREEYTRRYC